MGHSNQNNRLFYSFELIEGLDINKTLTCELYMELLTRNSEQKVL